MGQRPASRQPPRRHPRRPHNLPKFLGALPLIAKHLIIAGQVQGVGYRDWLKDMATRIGLTGWVRNKRDGTVEALIAGDVDAVEEVVRACRRGPRMAIVDDIHETLSEPPTSRDFTKRPTM